MLKVSFIVRCLGPKSYGYLRNILALPSRQTLENHFGNIAKGWRDVLMDIDSIKIMIMLFRQMNNISEDQLIDSVIGIDAMSIEPIFEGNNGSKNENKKQSNNVFMINLMPLEPQYKQLPIHIMTKDTGSADLNIKMRINKVIEKLKEVGVNVLYKATDGDKGYMEWHWIFFNKWWQLYHTEGACAAYEYVRTLSEIPITDPLHIGKNMRSRILNGTVSLRIDGRDDFTAHQMEEVLKLGDALTDKSPTGKMKDFYVLEIFNLKNFFELMKQKQFSMALYILPLATWFEALRNPNLTFQARLEFLEFTFQIFIEHRNWVENLAPGVTQNKKKKGVQYYCSRSSLTRILNTLIAMIAEIKRKPKSQALDRMGTHPLECLFGQVRLLCNYKHTLERVMKNISKVLIVKSLSTELNLPLKIRNRINIGGVKITGSALEFIYVKRPDENVQYFLQTIYIFINERVFPYISQEISEQSLIVYNDYMNWIHKTYCTWKHHGQSLEKFYKGSRVSNMTIISRLINFKSEDEFK